MEVQREIINGINNELAETPEYITLKILEKTKDGELWILKVEIIDEIIDFDESLEESKVEWENGIAEVLSIFPDTQELVLQYAQNEPPDIGEKIILYPPRYLEALKAFWSNKRNAELALTLLKKIKSKNHFKDENVIKPSHFRNLREKQKEAFNLFGWNVSFLWGPPGTGKTFTLGRMIAQYLIQHPDHKILLLSTTNTAVDQALISVDKALESINENISLVQNLRKKCKRIGHNFIPKFYAGREHLLPSIDPELFKKLLLLEKEKPDKKNHIQYAEWKKSVDEIKAKIREEGKQIIEKNTVIAMTTTRAVFTFDYINEFLWELIIFDEASQVSIPHALAIAHIGEKVVFTGDPKQLAPVCRSSHPHAKKWLSKSMFEYTSEYAPNLCMLDEQSRMAEPISEIVSKMFYKGKLRLAKNIPNIEEWKKERDTSTISPFIGKHLYLLTTEEKGTWSKKYNGPIRYKSAYKIVNIIKYQLLSKLKPSEIIVLTPFRAQKKLIQKILSDQNINHLNVSTVHKSQGQEYKIVIFDPVNESSNFLKPTHNPDATRLINVAISRAKAGIIVALNTSDLTNPLFKQLFTFIIMHEWGKKLLFPKAVPIDKFINEKSFPEITLNKIVKFNDVLGIVSQISEDLEKIYIWDLKSGKERAFLTKKLKELYSK